MPEILGRDGHIVIRAAPTGGTKGGNLAIDHHGGGDGGDLGALLNAPQPVGNILRRGAQAPGQGQRHDEEKGGLHYFARRARNAIRATGTSNRSPAGQRALFFAARTPRPAVRKQACEP